MDFWTVLLIVVVVIIAVIYVFVKEHAGFFNFLFGTVYCGITAFLVITSLMGIIAVIASIKDGEWKEALSVIPATAFTSFLAFVMIKFALHCFGYI